MTSLAIDSMSALHSACVGDELVGKGDMALRSNVSEMDS